MRSSALARMRRGPITRPRTIDPVDRAIIEALQQKGRGSWLMLANVLVQRRRAKVALS